jgi:drug/metabolite transporter (DMT)-like permease
MMVQLTALACVLGLVAGQLLFKVAAVAWRDTGELLSLQVVGAFMAAAALYAITSMAWVWVLRHLELGRAYPWMALAFVLVPIASHFMFGERLSTAYGVGAALIVIGIVVISQS